MHTIHYVTYFFNFLGGGEVKNDYGNIVEIILMNEIKMSLLV